MTKHYDYIAIGGGSAGLLQLTVRQAMAKMCDYRSKTSRWHLCKRRLCTEKSDVYGAQIAEAINSYAPAYGFDVEVKKFDYAKLVESRQAYIGRIHTSYNNVLAKITWMF